MQYCPHCMKPATGEVCPSCGGVVRWQAPTNQLPVGTLIKSTGGHVYQIGAAKGQGGFGITYAALDLMNQGRVAIKEYFPSRCASRDNVTRVIPSTGQQDSYGSGLRSFLEEAKMLSAVGALDSVVSVRDFFESNGTAYIVMEYVDGIPLHEVVRRKGRMSRDELFAILPPLLRDLGILHRAGVIHRDISPDNLILTKSGKLKLLDFGSARSLESGKALTVMLKAGFSPVEQYQSKGQGPYTDVYALAGTIYYCLTGVVPPSAIDRISVDELQLPNALGAGLTAQQQDALVWGMTVQPQSRPQNVEAFANALIPGGQPVPQAPGHTGYTGQNPQAPGYTGYTGHTGQNPQAPGHTGYTGHTGQNPQVPGHTGYTGHTGRNPQVPGHTGQNGYPGQVPQGYYPGQEAYPSQPRSKGFSKGLFIGIGAAVVLVVLLVAGLLIGNALNDTKKGGGSTGDDVVVRRPTQTEETRPIQTENTRPAAQDKVTEDGFRYRIENSEAVITGYTGSDWLLFFPDELDGYPVTILEEGCLAGNTTAQSALLPLHCREIRANAFYGCTDLRDVGCYSTVKVDSTAFAGCSRLRVVLRTGDANMNGWTLPGDCRVFAFETETGIGGLSSAFVDDEGVIYGITEDSNAVVMDIPGDITYYAVPEDCFGYPVLWVWEGALDHASPSLSVYMCPEMAFDYSLVNEAEWDCENIYDFCYNWYMACAVCDEINASRPSGSRILPDRKIIEVAMIRAEELSRSYSYSRPSGEDWGKLLDEREVDWTDAMAENYKLDTETDGLADRFEAALLDIADSFSGYYPDSSSYYSGMGVATYYDETQGLLFVHAIGVAVLPE